MQIGMSVWEKYGSALNLIEGCDIHTLDLQKTQKYTSGYTQSQQKTEELGVKKIENKYIHCRADRGMKRVGVLFAFGLCWGKKNPPRRLLVISAV